MFISQLIADDFWEAWCICSAFFGVLTVAFIVALCIMESMYFSLTNKCTLQMPSSIPSAIFWNYLELTLYSTLAG